MTVKRLLFIIALAMCLPAHAVDKLPPPTKILFIGNSFTFWNKGLWYHTEQLALARPDKLKIKAAKVVRGGASLKVMWGKSKSRETISKGKYDIVVLQEDIPETNVKTFHQYARKFEALIRQSGAKPVFFMAWPYKRLGWINMKEIAEAHRVIGTELKAPVAPVGLAWVEAKKQQPKVVLYDKDKEHPSTQGTYLALCVIYCTIYDENPEKLEYMPKKSRLFSAKNLMTDKEAAWLRHIAWQTVQAWQKGK